MFPRRAKKQVGAAHARFQLIGLAQAFNGGLTLTVKVKGKAKIMMDTRQCGRKLVQDRFIFGGGLAKFLGGFSTFRGQKMNLYKSAVIGA